MSNLEKVLDALKKENQRLQRYERCVELAVESYDSIIQCTDIHQCKSIVAIASNKISEVLGEAEPEISRPENVDP